MRDNDRILHAVAAEKNSKSFARQGGRVLAPVTQRVIHLVDSYYLNIALGAPEPGSLQRRLAEINAPNCIDCHSLIP